MTKEDHDKTNKATKNKTKQKQNKKQKNTHNKYQTRVVNGRPRFFLLLVTVIVH